MSKFRKVLITVLLTCLTVCVALAVAACGGKSMYPDFRDPGNGGNDGGEYRGKYVISVKSAGGLALSNITVSAVKGGEVKMTGISSEEGKIEFGLPSDEYQLVVDEEALPAGYFVPNGTSYKTTADKENAEVVLSSKVISNTMTSNTRYSVGDIMHNFSFTNSYGMQFTLEELFETKKAVVLNFWYTTCTACMGEFPALERAYKAYSDTVSVVALDDSNDDSAEDIAKFQSDYNLTFHCARDNAGITTAFGVTAFPTTVVIDRYGVIAEMHAGSIPQESTWKALFNKYSSDDYTQDDPSNGGNDNPTPTERPKFDGSIEMPASSVLATNVAGEGAQGKINNFRPETSEKDAPYSWPWVVGEGGGYMTASNSKQPFSYATVYIDVSLESGDALSYEYKVDTEAGCDILYALINGQIVGEHSGNSTGTSGSSDGWVRNYGVYVADHTVTVTLSFLYIKDQLNDSGTDTASIRNITITDVTQSEDAIDQRVSVIDGKTLNSGSYGLNENVVLNKADGYYYYTDENNEEYLLLANIIEVSPWSEKHFGADNFKPEDGRMQPASLYHISFWYMSNYATKKDDESLKFNYGEQAITDVLIRNYYLQEFSDNTLVPLTEELKNAMIEFTKAYAEEHKNDGDRNKYAYYEDQWLEMCYFYRHYGAPRHDMSVSAAEDRDNCFRYKDPVKGLSAETAYSVNLPNGNFEETIYKTKIYNNEYGSGVWYKITLPRRGIYHFTTSKTEKNMRSDPRVALFQMKPDGSVGDEVFDEYVDLRYDKFSRNTYEQSNVFAYEVLDAGTYYLQCGTRVPNETAIYDIKIELLPETRNLSMIKVCSTSEGMWTYTLDGFIYYLAIPTVLGQDGIYYHNNNNSYGSKIYIDFVHGNYFDQENHTLEWLLTHPKPDGTEYFGSNTTRMKQFLAMSKQGKKKTDPTFGLIEASSELVNLLANFIQNFNSNFSSDGLNTGAWKMFACYYEYYVV